MKRKYLRDLDFVLRGIEACRHNAARLLAASKDALEAGRSGLALALSTLALEEIGKLLFVYGLLFARHGDHKDQALEKGFRNHTRKLFSLIRFPLAVDAFARLDPRYESQPAYRQAIALSLNDWNQARHALAPWIGEDCALDSLDHWKQRGFYVDISQGDFVDPDEAIPREFAERVVLVTHLTVDVIGFIFKDNLERYRETAERIRRVRAEHDHVAVQQLAEELVEEFFAGLERDDEGAT